MRWRRAGRGQWGGAARWYAVITPAPAGAAGGPSPPLPVSQPLPPSLLHTLSLYVPII